jgi:predicted dehydrogenase
MIRSNSIAATGTIAAYFVTDLLTARTDAKAKHVIQAIGSRTLEKSQQFADKFSAIQGFQPTSYGSYQEVYDDPNIDIVYIGTPHGLHKGDLLAAVTSGKNVLCEKAFTVNASEAREVFDAARKAGVYVAEAMWLRHRPLVTDLRKLLFEDKVIGEVFRTTSEFQTYVDFDSLPPESRHKDMNLGPGSLLDMGIYPLTWAVLMLDHNSPSSSEMPEIKAVQSFLNGIEVTTSVVLRYASTGRQGIATSTTRRARGIAQTVAVIDGTDGFVEVHGIVPSLPSSFTVYPRWTGIEKPVGKKHDYGLMPKGFVYEADNAALDLLAGRHESSVMPWSETIHMLEIMDEIRRQGGTVYPADKSSSQ